jgi:hypothetical protein
MIWLARIGVAAMLVAVSLSASAQSADVECALNIGPVTEQQAKKLWPSGVTPTPETCEVGLLRGVISRGDYEKIVDLYSANHPFLHEFFLQSPGGNPYEAMKIGRLFRKYLISAWAPRREKQWRLNGVNLEFVFGINPDKTLIPICEGDDCICASACALIWFGSPERSGTVGFHRAYDESLKGLSPAAAATAYKQVLDDETRYLEEMEVPRPIIDKKLSTGSGEISWMDNDSSNMPPSFTEWRDVSCGHITDDDTELHSKLLAKLECEGTIINNARDKLPNPKAAQLPDFSGEAHPVQ